MKKIVLLSVVLLAAALLTWHCCLAQETVVTKDGGSVVLNPDGTWKYLTKASPSAASALEVVRSYLSVPSWRDRLAYVLNQDRVRPLMEAHYGGIAWKSPQSEFQVVTADEPTPNETGWVKVEAEVRGTNTQYYLKKTKDGYRIDWEMSVGFNATSPEAFRATRPTTPVRFRVLAKLSDYYNYEFSEAQAATWSIDVADGAGKTIGNGYVTKNSTAGAQLFGTLKDGTWHRLVVDLQYLPNAQNASVFLISRLISVDSWWIPEGVGSSQR